MSAAFRPLLCVALLASALFLPPSVGAAQLASAFTAAQSGVAGSEFYRSLAQGQAPTAQASPLAPATLPGATGPASFYESLAQPLPGAAGVPPGASGYGVAVVPVPFGGVPATSPFPALPGDLPVYVVQGDGLTVLGPGQYRDPIYSGTAVAPTPPVSPVGTVPPTSIPPGPPPPVATAPPPTPALPSPPTPPQTAAVPVRRDDGPTGISELRIGVLAHDVAISEGEESGVDINPEILFTSPGFLEALGSPRPHLGLSISTEGDTNQIYAGLTWDYFPAEWLFLEGAFGGALHDGNLDSDSDSADGNNYGCAAGFHFQAGLGFLLWDHFTLAAVAQYMSNLGLCSENDGLFNAGARFGYRF